MLKEEKSKEILDLLKPVKFLSLTEICKKIGVSRRHTRRILTALYYQKKINTTGSPRCFNYYFIKE